MAKTSELYPPTVIRKRYGPWLVQLLLVIALSVLALASYGLWSIVNVQTRTLELPTMERPANGPANDPPEERPQRNAPMPSPLDPSPMPATP